MDAWDEGLPTLDRLSCPVVRPVVHVGLCNQHMYIYKGVVLYCAAQVGDDLSIRQNPQLTSLSQLDTSLQTVSDTCAHTHTHTYTAFSVFLACTYCRLLLGKFYSAHTSLRKCM